MDRDGDQQIIAVDNWIKFQAPHHIAKLVKVCFYSTNPHGHVIVSTPLNIILWSVHVNVHVHSDTALVL